VSDPAAAALGTHATGAPPAVLAVTDDVATGDGARRRPKLGWFFWVCLSFVALVVFGAIFAGVLPLQDPGLQTATQNGGPSAAHWFGTDDLGRDIFSRVVYGARVSLVVGFGAIGIGLLVGGTLGMLAGYRRGRTDSIVNAGSYVLLAFPALIAVIAIVSFWGHQEWKIVLILGIFSAPLLFRVIRAATLSCASRDFVTAAQALGATDRRILAKEVFPNIAPAVISFSLIGVATIIVLEGSLAFLGASIDTNSGQIPSWGNMLNEGRTFLQSDPWLTVFPAIAMFCFLLALNFLGDRLRQHYDVGGVKL